MKYLFLFVALLMLFSCSDESDDQLISPLESKTNQFIIASQKDGETTKAAQRAETDFNFVLRAHFKPQTVEITRSSGLVETIRFQGNLKVWRSGRVDGRIVLGQPNNGQVYSLQFTRTGVTCDGVLRIIEIDATVSSNNPRSPVDVLITLSSRDGDDDPDCLIWDIMDGGGHIGGTGDGSGSISYVAPCD